jgi:hypothetical protein
MSIVRLRLAKFLNYVAEGAACGVGGLLLFGLPFSIIMLCSCILFDEKGRRGSVIHTAVMWLWNHSVSASIPARPQDVFPALLVMGLIIAFCYGWWWGMHRVDRWVESVRIHRY